MQDFAGQIKNRALYPNIIKLFEHFQQVSNRIFTGLEEQ